MHARPTARFRIPRALGALLATSALLCCWSALGADDAPSIELSWSGPSTEVACLGGEGLTRAVNGYLGRHAITSPPGELLLNVVVERQKDGWRALIKINDQRSNTALGERELFAKGPLCSGLDEPLKLAVALLVDSELVAQPVDREAKSPPRVKEPPPPEPEPEPHVSDSEPPPLFESQRVRLSFDASLLLEKGILPGPAAGLELGAELTAADWIAFRARIAGFVPQSQEPAPDARITAATFHGGIALCPRSELQSRWTILGCFGVEGGYLNVARGGLSGGRDAHRRLVMATLSPRISWDLNPKIALVAHGVLLFPAREDRFVIDLNGNQREIFEIAQVVWSLGLGASVAF